MPDSELRTILSEYEPKVRSYFGRRMRHSHDIEDLVQETMCAIIEGYNRFQGKSAVSTWVYAICSHQLGSFHRRERRDTDLLKRLFASVDPRTAGEDSPEFRALIIDVAYDRLQKTMKKLFEDRYRKGLTIKQIAKEYGQPEGTVKYRHYMLRIELRRILGRVAGAPRPE